MCLMNKLGWASGRDSSSGCAREPYPQASSGRAGGRKEGRGDAVADKGGGLGGVSGSPYGVVSPTKHRGELTQSHGEAARLSPGVVGVLRVCVCSLVG